MLDRTACTEVRIIHDGFETILTVGGYLIRIVIDLLLRGSLLEDDDIV